MQHIVTNPVPSPQPNYSDCGKLDMKLQMSVSRNTHPRASVHTNESSDNMTQRLTVSVRGLPELCVGVAQVVLPISPLVFRLNPR